MEFQGTQAASLERMFKGVFASNDAPVPQFKVTAVYANGDRNEKTVNAINKREALHDVIHMKDERPTLCSVVRIQ